MEPGHLFAVLGSDMQCISVNRDWLRFRGRTLAQERGEGWIEGIHPEDRQTCLAMLRLAYASRQPFQSEFRFRSVDGSYVWLIAFGVPQYIIGGKLMGYTISLEEPPQRDRKSVDTEGGNAARSMRQALSEIAAGLEALDVR